MAISWHWAWGPETAPALIADYGFSFNFSGSDIAPTSAVGEVYTYAGSPTRYSMAFRSIRTYVLPAAAFPSTARGWVAVPFKDSLTNTVTVGADILVVTGSNSGRAVYVDIGSDGKSLRLYVDDQFKESTLPFDWTDWHYVALQWDMSSDPWSGRLYVDGVAVTAAYTDARPAEVSGSISGASAAPSTSLEWLIGQVIVHDNPADAGEVPRFVTRVEPNADGTNIGTWTPSAGPDDYAVLDTPLDVTSYTQNTAPVALNRVEVLTNNGGANLTSALGTLTSAIDSVMVHGYSQGQSVTARALVGDGTVSETAGPSEVLSVGTTSYTPAVANTKPSGGAWSGTDAPEFIFEVQ
jgi:hypothetical protein